jgi:hypothetical protein
MCGSANAPEDFVARKLEGSFGEIDRENTRAEDAEGRCFVLLSL